MDLISNSFFNKMIYLQLIHCSNLLQYSSPHKTVGLPVGCLCHSLINTETRLIFLGVITGRRFIIPLMWGGGRKQGVSLLFQDNRHMLYTDFLRHAAQFYARWHSDDNLYTLEWIMLYHLIKWTIRLILCGSGLCDKLKNNLVIMWAWIFHELYA